MIPSFARLSFVFAVILSGCQTPAPVAPSASKTTVILLPDEDGKVGAVTIKTAAGVRTIDRAYHYVQVTGETAGLPDAVALPDAQLDDKYADLLKAQPAKAMRFVLYFNSGSTNLTKESQAIIPKVVSTLRSQSVANVTIIGHTDTKGAEEINEPLSLNRARAMEKLLKGQVPALENVNVYFFGSRELLVPTASNADEPRNRRVEILIL